MGFEDMDGRVHCSMDASQSLETLWSKSAALPGGGERGVAFREGQRYSSVSKNRTVSILGRKVS